MNVCRPNVGIFHDDGLSTGSFEAREQSGGHVAQTRARGHGEGHRRRSGDQSITAQ